VMDGLLYYATLGGFGGRHQRRVEPGSNQTFALDARTGQQVWSFPDGAYSPVVADRDRVYVVGRTRVYGLEEKNATKTAKR
jgi:outer membrane protein assembly factor BamB